MRIYAATLLVFLMNLCFQPEDGNFVGLQIVGENQLTPVVLVKTRFREFVTVLDMPEYINADGTLVGHPSRL